MDYKAFKRDCIGILRQSIGEDYVEFVFDKIGVGRVLCNRLGVEF